MGLSSHPHTPSSTARERFVLRHRPNALLSLVQHRGCWSETSTFPFNGILFPHIHTPTHHRHCFLGQGHCWSILLKAQEKEGQVIASPGNSMRPKHQQLSDSPTASEEDEQPAMPNLMGAHVCSQGLPWTCFQYPAPITGPPDP